MLRTIVIVFAVFLTLLAGAAVLIPIFFDEKKILAIAAENLKEKTGTTLEVGGEAKLSLFPQLGLAVSDIAITSQGQTAPDVSAKALQIGVHLLPLLSRKIEVDSITLGGLHAKIAASEDDSAVDTSKMSDAQLDKYYAEQRQQREAAGKAVGAEAALAIPLALNVANLRITDSRLEMASATAAEPPTIVDIHKLKASNMNLHGSPIPLELALRIPSDRPIDVALTGDITVNQETQQATLQNLATVVSGATVDALNIEADGTFDLTRRAADLTLRLRSKDTQGSGKLRYALLESPQIDADLTFNQLDPALFILAGTEAAKSDTPSTSSDEPLPLDALRTMDTRAALRVDAATFGAHTIENLAVSLRAVEGIVTVKQLTGTLHGGNLDATGTFNGKHKTATLQTRGKLTALDIARAAQAAESQLALHGNASLNWQLSGRGATRNGLTRALSGPIKLRTQAVTLKDTSVEKLLCQAVALGNGESLSKPFDSDTKFETVRADIQLEDGIAHLRPLRAELAHIGLQGNGQFSLLDQVFNATFKARLSPSMEELDPACRLSKRLAAIEWPLKCAGKLGADNGNLCSVDSEAILRNVAVQEGRKKLEKKAGKLLEKFFNNKDNK